VLNLLEIIKVFFRNRELIKQFTTREIIARYKGSYLGLLWSFITPVFMLLIYTYFFGFVMKARWAGGSDNKVEFALLLFCGLIVFGIFSEVLTRSPSLIITNSNYVKKVVFPIEIFPIVAMGSALFQALINLFILVLGTGFLLGTFNWTLIFLPLVLIPVVLLTLGLGWIFASLGVFFRDISQIIALIVPALMFLSPIFYPITSIPQKFQWIYHLNPISFVVEDMRNIVIWGKSPDLGWLVIGSAIGLVVSIGGFWWFQKTRKGFADIL
jgi:lipopolysaccharide transport system permease protein